MIVRISTLLVLRSQSDTFLECLRQNILPAYESAEGFRFVLLLKRHFVAYTEASLLSMWDSEDEMNRFFKETRDSLPTQQEDLVIEKDPCIYTVVTAHQRESPETFYAEGAD